MENIDLEKWDLVFSEVLSKEDLPPKFASIIYRLVEKAWQEYFEREEIKMRRWEPCKTK